MSKSNQTSRSFDECEIRPVRINAGQNEVQTPGESSFEYLWNHLGGRVTLEETKRYYDLMANRFEELMADQNYNGPDIIIEKVKELGIESNARILDLGCGTGLLGKAMITAGYPNIDGIDMSEEMLRTSKKKNIYSLLKLVTLEPNTDLSSLNSYSLICLLCSFQPGHITPLCLENISKLLLPGGYIIWARSSRIPVKHFVDSFEHGEFTKIKQKLAERGIESVSEHEVENFTKGMAGQMGIFKKLS